MLDVGRIKHLTPASADVKRGAFFCFAKNVTLFTVSCMHLLAVHFSDTTAIASISNKNSGFAKPETKSTVTSGGFGRFPQTC